MSQSKKNDRRTFDEEFKRESAVIRTAFVVPDKKPVMRTITVTKPTGLRIKFSAEKYDVKVTEGEVVISPKK